MAPPVFNDLGKPANNVFEKGYPLGSIRFEATSDSCKNPEFKLVTDNKFVDGTFEGNVECKYKVPEYGVTVTKKWNTENELVVEAACDEKISPGLKVAMVGALNPDTGAKNAQGKIFYKVNNAIAEGNVTLGDNTNTMLNGTVVGGYKGFLGGYQVTYDTNDSSLKKNNLALLYCAQDVQVGGKVTNMGERYSGSIYQRVSGRAEVAAQFSYVPSGAGSGTSSASPTRRTSAQSSAPPEPSRNDVRIASAQSTAPPAEESAPPSPPPPPQQSASFSTNGEDENITFAIGGRYLLDANNSIRGKINCKSQLSLSYETKVRDGTTVTAATLVDMKNMSGGGHKVGLGIEFII